MKTKTTLIALATATALSAGAVQADTPVAAEIRAEIEKVLTALGYEVRDVEGEDGGYEVNAIAADGSRNELELDANFQIVSTELDDDDDEGADHDDDEGPEGDDD